MIVRLRKRLTLAATAALILIFAVTVAAINLANAWSLRGQISQSLQMLTGSNTKPEEQVEAASAAERRERAGLPAVRASALARITDFCVIRLNKNGDVHEWKTESDGVYNDEIVAALASAAWKNGQGEGRLGDQAYRAEARKYGTLIVAMAITPEIAYTRTLLRITLLAGAAACALLSLLSALLIRRTLRPVREAMEKQRQFVWDASHELKTPLAVISANAQVLEKELGGNPYFGYIRSEIRQMDSLVQSLLTLARLEAGKMQADFTRFDLGAALLQLALPMESLAFEQGKTLDIQVTEGVFCRGNAGMLTQMASILLSNAFKYSPAGAAITLQLTEHGRALCLRVHNTGSCIPPSEREKVFDRFYRAESAAQTQGSGIGLAIARSIAALHHGDIFLESNEASGTAFIVTLPEDAK